MKQEVIEGCNSVDTNGNPTGGHATGIGINVHWQDGPLGRGVNRTEPNGAFVEGVIETARQRLEFYQVAGSGRFQCEENAMAIMRLDEALAFLLARTTDRELREVEGTHTP